MYIYIYIYYRERERDISIYLSIYLSMCEALAVDDRGRIMDAVHDQNVVGQA